MKLLCGIFFVLLMACKPPAVWGFESVRAQEINECRPGEAVSWGDGQDRAVADAALVFLYDATAAPEGFAPELVAGMVKKSALAWSLCGLPTRVLTAREQDAGALHGVIRIQWNEPASGGNFGLANLGQRTLSLGPAAFALLKQRNPAHDARETLQMVISHEMGHFYGLLAHSRRCVDVLSYYQNAKGERCNSRDASQMRYFTEYRHTLPTACDIERCRKVNGLPPLTAAHPR